MATTGKAAWDKYFAGKQEVETAIKKEAPIFGPGSKQIGTLKVSTPITVFGKNEYSSQTLVRCSNGMFCKVAFSNIQKPRGGRVSGIKLKPQDFKFFRKELWRVDELSKALVDEIEERTDLEPKLKNYLIALTTYYGSRNQSALATVKQTYSMDMPGMNEIQKDYGEIIGAMACITKGLLKKEHPEIPVSAMMNFPLRGNEPLVDYYIQFSNHKVSVSAKSGTTTNTLKPTDVIKLLESQGKTNKWKHEQIYKVMELVSDTSIIEFPFHAINVTEKKELVSKQALDSMKGKFSNANMASKDYDSNLFGDLIMHLGFKTIPTIGELFAETEKAVITTLNRDTAKITRLFNDAIAGAVIYVKYKITPDKPEGKFETISEVDTNHKPVKFRSKNYAGRAADRIGLQP